MSTTTITTAVILTTVVVVSTYTAWRAANDTPGDTVSETLRRWASRGPVVPLAIGVLAGHWLAPGVDSPAWGPPALAVAGLVAAAQARWWPVEWSRWASVATLAVGGALGALLWSQG